MKTQLFKSILTGTLLLTSAGIYAQLPSIQYYRYNDLRGLNVFETSKKDTVKYQGLTLRIGGDFAMQFQGLTQSNDAVAGSTNDFVDLSQNMTLPTANMNFDVQLEDGMRMHLRVYLSSRHHPESYVKGGYLQIDKLDFIKPGLLSGLMELATIRVGMDEFNYGDLHFRRSDNARTIFNPFVGNYIMDSFTTEPFLEVTLQGESGIFGVIGMTNGRLNQDPEAGDDGRVFFGKLGYDKQMNDDLRFRLTGSFYTSSSGGTRDYLYGGDRAGARYYNVLHTIGDNDPAVNPRGPSDFEPRFNPGFAYLTSFMVNPFVKYQGVEFFGTFESITNGDSDIGGNYTQLGGELLYRFGGTEQLFLGGRYNTVSGEATDGAETRDINRLHIGGGWYMTKNVMVKGEYVTSTYDGEGWTGSKLQGAEFDGMMIEATIGF